VPSEIKPSKSLKFAGLLEEIEYGEM
jgi:hypothetical protein